MVNKSQADRRKQDARQFSSNKRNADGWVKEAQVARDEEGWRDRESLILKSQSYKRNTVT